MPTILRRRNESLAAASAAGHAAADLALAELEVIGFTAFNGLIGAEPVAELRAEALHQRREAKAAAGTSGHGYQARLAPLGASGRAFLANATMTSLFRALFDAPLIPNEVAGCYTFYEPGDFLGAHTDHPEECLVTAIVYLEVARPARPPKHTGLELHILAGAPSDGHRLPRKILPTQTGALIIGLGSTTWHERPPLQAGEHLVAMTACYSRAPAVTR